MKLGVKIIGTDFEAIEKAGRIKIVALDKTGTVTKGEPDVYRWQVDITLTLAKKGTFTPKIKLSYTSGTSKSTAMEKFREIPLKITVK